MRIGGESIRDLESSLVRQLRTGHDASRIDLARRLELAPSTVGQYVDRLIGGGYLREGRKATQPAGRPPTVLHLNPSAGHFVGVDFEARRLWVTTVDFAQRPLSHRRVAIRVSDNAEQVVVKIEEEISAASQEASSTGQHGPLLGIGVGVPGAVDPHRGVGLHYQHIRGWEDVHLRQRLVDRFSKPIHIENNIRVMALAEELFGQGRGLSDFVCLGIRSGIAAGVVTNGHLHSGSNNLAGEIGGWPCEHGKSLEESASLTALGRQLEEAILGGQASGLTLRRGRLPLDEIPRAAQTGDRLVLDALRDAGCVVGRVLAQLNLLLNPQRIIIAGPLAALEEEFVRVVRETLEPLATPPHAMRPTVSGSQLGEFAGALGGAALAVRGWTPAANPR